MAGLSYIFEVITVMIHQTKITIQQQKRIEEILEQVSQNSSNNHKQR